MKNTYTRRNLNGIATAVVLMFGAGSIAQGGNVFWNNDSDTGNESWSVDANWTSGFAPWGTPSAPADDLGMSASIIVDSTETYTTGANSGNAFQFRRVSMNGTRTMTIVDGGTFDFGGGADGRILLSNSGNQILMSGGTLLSDSGNLNGINISGSGALFQIGGSSTVNIFDPGGASQGVAFSGGSAKGMTVIGSSASISLEALKLSGSNIDLSFQLDTGGASAVGITDAVAWDDATSVSLNLTNPGNAWNGIGNILFYDLTAGSSGTFDSIVTDVATYSATEGELIQLNPGGDTFTFTYLMGDGNDIGLIGVAIPEPSTLAMLVIGAAGLALRRKKLRIED